MAFTDREIWFVHPNYDPPLPLRFRRTEGSGVQVTGGKTGSHFTGHGETYWNKLVELVKLAYIPVAVAKAGELLDAQWFRAIMRRLGWRHISPLRSAYRQPLMVRIGRSGQSKVIWQGRLDVRCWSTISRSIAILAIVVAHCALVPIAISITLRCLGFENALTITNQITWTPIVGAQCSLLALYLGFGAGHAYLRGSLFAAGITYVLLTVVWANSMLCIFPEPKFQIWLAQIRGYSLSFALPTFLAGIALIPLRLLLGTARGQQSPSNNQFRIADLLLVTFLVAAILGWYQYAMDDHIDIRNSAMWIVFNAAGAVGCLLLVLSRKWWWIGLIVLILSLLAQSLDSRNGGWSVGWLAIAYPWGIVIMTLTAFRLLGVRLHGQLPATAK